MCTGSSEKEQLSINQEVITRLHVVAKKEMSSDQKITDKLHLKEQIGSGTLVHKTDEVCSVKLIFHRTDN